MPQSKTTHSSTEQTGKPLTFARACRDRVALLSFSTTFIMTVGVSSITPVLPVLMRTFDVSPPMVAMIITIFTLPGVFMLPVVGMLADRYGRKAVLLPTIVMFILGGIACACATSFSSLLFFRLLQGVGSVALGFLPSVIVADHYEGAELTAMMGYNAAVLSVGTAMAPLLGGLFGAVNWRLAFLLPILGLIPLVASYGVSLNKGKAQSGMRAYWGTALKAMCNKGTIILFCMGFLTFMMLYGPVITCLPILQDIKYAASPRQIGVFAAFMSLGALMSAGFLGKLSARYGLRKLLIGSQICYMAALVLIPRLPVESTWMLALPVMLYGVGQGLNTPIVSMLQVRRAPADYRAAIMSAHSVLLRLAQSVGPVLFGHILYKFSLTAAFLTGAGVAFIMLCLSIMAPGGDRKKT